MNGRIRNIESMVARNNEEIVASLRCSQTISIIEPTLKDVIKRTFPVKIIEQNSEMTPQILFYHQTIIRACASCGNSTS